MPFRLGAVDKLDNTLVNSLVKSSNQIFKNNQTALINNESSHVSQIVNWGASTIIKTLWKQFHFPQLIQKLKLNSRLKFDIDSALQLLLTSRILQPKSKLALFNNQHNYGGLKQIELHNIYRSLNFLTKHQEPIQVHLYNQQVQNTNINVDVVFYDVTTFYFESVKQDSLRDFGFSKDCKVNNVQIIFSMLVDLNGRPIGCNIHKGNCYEGHTLIAALEKMKQKYNIKQVVIVADKGINNSTNLHIIRKAGYNYIISFKYKNSDKNTQAKIKDIESYQVLQSDAEGGRSVLGKSLDYEKVVKIDGQAQVLPGKLICSWSQKRATKDQADRARLIDRAEDMIDNKGYQSSRGARKFLNVSINNKVSLNEEKILEDAQWDGIYVLEASATHLSSEQVYKAYHQLWVIEESFRILKSHSETRPVFHWTPERITGHLILNYIAFCFERAIEIKLKDLEPGAKVSHSKIREAIS